MSGQRAQRDLRGFVLHDTRITFDNLEANDASATGSDYTQTGPGPGQAEPYDSLGTYLPRAHHAQPNDLDVIALRAGVPALDTGAGIAYRENGEVTTSYRGWNEPNLAMGFRVLEWSTTADFHFRSDAVACPGSGQVVVVATDSGATLPPSSWVWDPTTRTWGNRVSIDADLSGGLVCVLRLRQTGRLLVLRVPTAGGTGAIYYSDNDGTSWGEYAPFAIRGSTIDSGVDRIRWVEDRNGAILLVAVDDATGDYWQYASTDGGANFELIGSGTADLGRGAAVTLAANGNIVITYPGRGVNTDILCRVITDAFDSIANASEETAFTGAAISYICATCDADGVIYCFGSEGNTLDQTYLIRSTDHGATWNDYDDPVLQLGGGAAGDIGDQRYLSAMAHSGGELLAIFTSWHNTTTPSSDGSLLCLVLGGWSTIEAGDTSGRRTDRYGWGDNSNTDAAGIFLPDDIFDNYTGWVATGTAETISSGEHRFNPAAATSYVTLTAAGHLSGDMNLLLEARVISGGSLSTDECAFSHRRRTGALVYHLKLRFDGTGFRVRDASGAGTNLGTVAIDITVQKVQILILYGDIDTVSVFYKRYSESVWTLGVQANLGSDATALSTDVYEMGCIDSTTSDFRIGVFAFTHQGFTRGTATDATGSIPRMRWGKALTPAPYPVRDQVDTEDRMLHLSGSGGVARHQESWELPASYDYGIREIDPVLSPKPTRTWRSTSLDEQILTWDLGDNSRLGHSWAIGLALIRPNFRRAVLEVSTSAAPSTFVELGEYNSRVVVSSTFTRSGNLLEPGSAATPGLLYFGADALRRGFVTLDPSGTPVNLKIRKNQGGGWVARGMRTALELVGVDGSEPTSGNLHVNMSGGVLVIHQSAPTAYRRVRLRIPAQECPDDYYELGNIVLGSIWAVGRQWSRGWSRRLVPIIREEEDEAGTVYVEPRAEEENTYRRELTFAWQDGHAITGLWQGHPDYLSAADGTPGLVADHDVMHQLMGLLRASRGGAVPSVALLEIPAFTSTVLDPEMWSFGRLGVGQTAQFNNVQGSEGRSEVYRGESLTHVELRG